MPAAVVAGSAVKRGRGMLVAARSHDSAYMSESKEWTMVASMRRPCLFLLAAAALTGACTPEPVAPTTGQISDYIATVTAQNGQVTAALRDSAPPPASFGPGAQVTGSGKVKRGGSARINLAGEADFTHVYVSTPMAGGCWDVTLPAGVTVEDLVLALSPNLRSGRLKVRYTLEGPSGVGGATEEVLDIGD